MIECPTCALYSKCPGPDSDDCPNKSYIHEDCVDTPYRDTLYCKRYQEYSDEIEYNKTASESTMNMSVYILHLFFVEGVRQREIVEITGKSKQYVSKLIVNSRPKMIEALLKTVKKG